jgi:hypothetical protein
MECFVGQAEKAQAEFRERCTDMPSQCRFRADGSIEYWIDKFEMPKALSDELVRRALVARTKRQLEEAK